MELTPFLFGLYKFTKYAFYPLTWVVVLLAITTWLLLLPQNAVRIKWARIGACASLLVLALISNPFLSAQLIGNLEAQYPALSPPGAQRYEAIVVLGGGILEAGSLRPTIELSSYSHDRTTCGVTLYQQGYAPKLVVTGGDARIFGSGPIEALEMKRWAQRLGVPPGDILTEEGSRTTYENATGTKRLLGEASILLVSSASHLPRAVPLFERQGFRVMPVPCDYVARDQPGEVAHVNLFHFLPTDTAIQHTREAVTEVAGIFLYRLMGKL